MLKVARRLMPYFGLYPWSFALISLLGILASLAEGIGIGLFIPFLQDLEQGVDRKSDVWLINALDELFASVPPENRLLVICLCIFLSITIKAILNFASKCLFHWLDAEIIHRQRSIIVDQLLRVDYRFIELSQTGAIVNTLGNETWRSSEAMAEFVNFVISASTLVVYGLLLLLISWQLTLLVFLVMILISMLIRWITERAESLGKEATRASQEVTIGELEVVEGMKVIRTNNREDYARQKFGAASRRAAEAIRHVAVIREWVTPVYEVLAAGFLVAVLYASLGSGMPLAALLVFLFVLYRLQPLVKALDESRIRIASLGGAVDAVTDLVEDTKTVADGAGRQAFNGLNEEIRFDRVTFYYDSARLPALDDVSIRLPAGRTIALVGHSGAGKTTLVNLIAGLYENDSGELTADGIPLRQLQLASWRKYLAVVSQDPFLFNASIRENISYGRLDASFEEVVAAARDAEADSFIRELPNGYDTIIGERGVRLSGGQQQRVALARAIVREPGLLILDEATNALDNISEQAIQIALNRIRTGRTLIVIAHRLTTITHADLIVVLEKGRVVEQGAYQELIDRGGAFAKLYRAEFRP